jgi:hypothetical protein
MANNPGRSFSASQCDLHCDGYRHQFSRDRYRYDRQRGHERIQGGLGLDVRFGLALERFPTGFFVDGGKKGWFTFVQATEWQCDWMVSQVGKSLFKANKGQQDLRLDLIPYHSA